MTRNKGDAPNDLPRDHSYITSALVGGKVGSENGNFCLGAIFILRKDIGVGWWSRKWQFSLTLCSENVLT